MGFLRFAKEKSSNYFIIGHNDEELYLVGELLLDNTARTKVKELLNMSEGHSSKSGPFTFKKHGSQMIDIKFLKKVKGEEEVTTLEVEFNGIMLDNLIDAWEFYMLSKPTELILSRRHDSDTITLTHESFEK